MRSIFLRKEFCFSGLIGSARLIPNEVYLAPRDDRPGARSASGLSSGSPSKSPLSPVVRVFAQQVTAEICPVQPFVKCRLSTW